MNPHSMEKMVWLRQTELLSDRALSKNTKFGHLATARPVTAYPAAAFAHLSQALAQGAIRQLSRVRHLHPAPIDAAGELVRPA